VHGRTRLPLRNGSFGAHFPKSRLKRGFSCQTSHGSRMRQGDIRPAKLYCGDLIEWKMASVSIVLCISLRYLRCGCDLIQAVTLRFALCVFSYTPFDRTSYSCDELERRHHARLCSNTLDFIGPRESPSEYRPSRG